MRDYVWTTALLFASLFAIHMWRVSVEGGRMLVDKPFFAVSTVVPVLMCVWAWRLLRRQQSR